MTTARRETDTSPSQLMPEPPITLAELEDSAMPEICYGAAKGAAYLALLSAIGYFVGSALGWWA